MDKVGNIPLERAQSFRAAIKTARDRLYDRSPIGETIKTSCRAFGRDIERGLKTAIRPNARWHRRGKWPRANEELPASLVPDNI